MGADAALRYMLAGPSRFETEIRKSRFLALAAPIAAQADVERLLAAQHDARASHHCWAWRLGDRYRFFDDGEPGGTAGRPIWQALDSQSMDRTLVLVIRWFGGIKLGTGGLARAYGGAARRCLERAEKIELRAQRRVRCDCPYSDMERVKARLEEAGAHLEEAQFGAEGVLWEWRVDAERLADIEAIYVDQRRGQGQWRVL